MTQNKNFKKAVRDLSRSEGVSYMQALTKMDNQEESNSMAKEIWELFYGSDASDASREQAVEKFGEAAVGRVAQAERDRSWSLYEAALKRDTETIICHWVKNTPGAEIFGRGEQLITLRLPANNLIHVQWSGDDPFFKKNWSFWVNDEGGISTTMRTGDAQVPSLHPNIAEAWDSKPQEESSDFLRTFIFVIDQKGASVFSRNNNGWDAKTSYRLVGRNSLTELLDEKMMEIQDGL